MQLIKSVVIVREKESIVTRGIEKRLTEMGYGIHSTATAGYDVKKSLEYSNIFIIYLSSDLTENKREMDNLLTYSGIIREAGRNMILIGEKKYHDDIIAKVPSLAASKWIDRPLDLDELITAIYDIERDAGEDHIVEKISDEKNKESGGGSAAEPVTTQKTILIVDDDPSYATMVKEWLKDRYKVNVVTAGMQAITFLMKKKVDLILLDYEMPIVDGPQVLEMFRSEPELADIPVVFLTGVGDMESVKRVMALRPKGYVLKSTTREDLIEYLSKYI